VLADLEMPVLDGGAAIRAIRQALPTTRVIVLTAFDTDDRIIGALEAGASGYLLKGAPRAEIFHAIRVVHAGGALLQPVIASRLLRRVESPTPPTDTLTTREREVLGLIAQGRANKEIAAALSVTERTVKFHVSAILAKLGAGNRTEAVAFARERGLI
jgi:DNA-binding NarL/FixJ family response regulator